MAVVGTIQTRSWDDTEGKRHSVTEVIADEVYFTESRRSDNSEPSGQTNTQPQSGNTGGEGFFPGSDDDTTLPFDI